MKLRGCCHRRHPLRTGPHTLARRKPATVKEYRRCCSLFLDWCMLQGCWPSTSDELDDLLVEWKNWPPGGQHKGVTKGQFACAIAGAELAMPHVKGTLNWSRTVLNDWEKCHTVKHHIPISKGIALLLAITIALLGFPRLGAGLVIQQARGLRPSELLRLQAEDVTLPEALHFGDRSVAVLCLGARTGTKANRAQAVMVNGQRHALAMLFLRILVHSTPRGQRLVGQVTLARYESLMATACRILHLPALTPHGARAGFATDGVLQGKGFVELREEGRWAHDASLRIYLDACATAALAASDAARPWAAIIVSSTTSSRCSRGGARPALSRAWRPRSRSVRRWRPSWARGSRRGWESLGSPARAHLRLLRRP